MSRFYLSKSYSTQTPICFAHDFIRDVEGIQKYRPGSEILSTKMICR